ncbi:MAG: T9SS type A sorting domain-containing protein [Bacteroidetes bacterium]|nr:T9SS type A sorting domain-containing protein [Bacteroidota bacterium]
MKKIYFLALFITGVINAQIVNIPDANFKSRLISLGVDSNSDGEIQTSEALAITELDIRFSSITDATGVEAFTSLTKLYCSTNNISVLNISGLTQLTLLECSYNSIANLEVSSLVNLVDLSCSYNNISVLDVAPLTALKYLSCEHNQISVLDISNLNLDILNCTANQISTLSLTNSTQMSTLYCDGNPIASLDVTGLSNLNIFYFGSSALSSITFGTHPVLHYMIIYGSNIPNLSIPPMPMLWTFACDDSTLNSLDLSAFPMLYDVRLRNDPNISYLNVKNGVNFTSVVNIESCPNLLYACVDPIELDQTNQEFAAGNNNPNGHASVYCTFTPGGIFNTITGTLRYDQNNEGCDVNDLVQPYMKVKISNGTEEAYTMTDASGQYHFYTPEGNYTITPELEHPAYFTISPASATVSTPTANNITSTRDFCIAPNGVHNDLEVVIEPLSAPRPGFDCYYKIVYRNKGNQTMSIPFQTVTFYYNPDQMEIIETSESGVSLDSGHMAFIYENLLPFESRSIWVKMHIWSPTELIHPVNAGDIITLNASIYPVDSDDTPQDNVFELQQTAVNSQDPNLIECLEGDVVAPAEIGNYLHYNVLFENTGTASAVNVVVKDVIDPTQYDLNSLQVLSASHPVYTRIQGNVVEFIFENINLATSENIVNPILIGGHGNVLFKLKSKNNLQTGDSVMNRASIYFDYNAPISTNDATTTFALLSNSIFEPDNSISVWPNPAQDSVKITADDTILSIQLYDIQGRLLETHPSQNISSTLDISKRANGIYFIKATTQNGSAVQKLIKE